MTQRTFKGKVVSAHPKTLTFYALQAQILFCNVLHCAKQRKCALLLQSIKDGDFICQGCIEKSAGGAKSEEPAATSAHEGHPNRELAPLRHCRISEIMAADSGEVMF